MPRGEPRIVGWTDHALAKTQLLSFARADVEEAVLTLHEHRSRNTRGADWLVESGRLVVAYNYPARDEMNALIVTLWRRS